MAILTIAVVRRAFCTNCRPHTSNSRCPPYNRHAQPNRSKRAAQLLRPRQCCFDQHCESYGYWQNARSRMKVRRRCRTGKTFPGRLHRVSDDGKKIGHRPNNQYAAGFENKIFGVWCDETLFERKFLA